jgi:prepilin-type N-terminal cleavage/methylation domain-containing protein
MRPLKTLRQLLREPIRRKQSGLRSVGMLRGQSGLTMIEVMVSVVILAIAIAPAFDAMLRGRLLVAHRGEERMALRLVERKTEQLLSASYSAAGSDADIQSVNMSAGTHPIDSTILLVTRGDDDASNDMYGDLTWTVTPVLWTDPLGVCNDTNYKEVAVKLAWPAGAHRDSVVVATICG